VDEVAGLIRDFDSSSRMNLPGVLPALDLPAAYWAACLLMAGCRFLIARDEAPESMGPVLSMPCPSPLNESTVYSADLFLRFLPDLHRMAKRLAADDPLVGLLERVGKEWPLSSVGMDNTAGGSLESFIRHPGLAQVYADRVIAQRAMDRLDEPGIRRRVRSSYGAYPELCPEVSRFLEQPAAGPVKVDSL